MRVYETMFIVRPDLSEEQRNKLAENVKKFLEERLGATVDSVNRWGIRKFAYRLKKFWEGDYTVLYFTSNGENLDQLENYFKVHPEFLRWQTFRREDIEKKERRKQLEEKAKAQKVEATENLEVKVEN